MKSIFRSPEDISTRDKSYKSIFLAGSIEMGKAIDWQKECEIALSEQGDYHTFNPRRLNWDSTWSQSIDNPKFVEQVEWELNSLDEADIIIMFIDGKTLSPITLLELGLYAKSRKLHVICEEDFWRKGNVDIVCKRYNIKQYNCLEDVISYLKKLTLRSR
jgi:hypothetical protein